MQSARMPSERVMKSATGRSFRHDTLCSAYRRQDRQATGDTGKSLKACYSAHLDGYKRLLYGEAIKALGGQDWRIYAASDPFQSFSR